MNAKGLSEGKYLLVFDPGEEIKSTLLSYVQEASIQGGYFVAIGACERVTLAYFNMQKKEYQKIQIEEQVEIASLTGTVSLHDGQPKVHAHLVVGKWDGTAHAGHLIDALVRPTLELVLTVTQEPILRRKDSSTGLLLIDPTAVTLKQ